jgi:hypothetical protein
MPIVHVGSYHARRLSDKVLIAFHQACEQNDPEVALHLLSVFETMMRSRSGLRGVERQKSMDTLVTAHEQLWHIMHPADFSLSEITEEPSTEQEGSLKPADLLYVN